MKKTTILVLLVFLGVTQVFSKTETYLSNLICLVSNTNSSWIPQAPRISPDGNYFLYENLTPSGCDIWIKGTDGSDPHSLTEELSKTKKIGLSVENAYWHPGGNVIAFNEIPKDGQKTGKIYVAELVSNRIQKITNYLRGARPQFSKPNGKVLFYEFTKAYSNYAASFEDTYLQSTDIINSLSYSMIGKDSFHPLDNEIQELRGPIQDISANMELSHPSIAPNGTTILFTVRTSASKGELANLHITDADRQRILSSWKRIKSDFEKNGFNNIQHECGQLGIGTYIPKLGRSTTTYGAVLKISKIFESYKISNTYLRGVSKADVILCVYLGMLTDDGLTRSESYWKSRLFSRIYLTDVFGAKIEPLVPDDSGVPLPQKWATVSPDGIWVLFEAGLYTDRHLYLTYLPNRKTVKLTELGTYNSSGEFAPDGKTIFFESDRSGRKGIWKAELDLNAIRKIVQN